jgi:hypothetical protein
MQFVQIEFANWRLTLCLITLSLIYREHNNLKVANFRSLCRTCPSDSLPKIKRLDLKMPTLILKMLARCLLPLLIASCAASVTHVPADMTSVPEASRKIIFQIDRKIDIQLDTGYSRSLKAGSEWTHVGRIRQGDVCKPHDGIFTLEGTHVHEAWLVVADGRLTGFYLPVERGFSPITGTNEVSLSSTRNNKEQ